MNKDEAPAKVNTHRADSKKHVTVNNDPEIFTIRPDTLEVERQERPKPTHFSYDELSLEELSAKELANLVEETADIIQFCEEKVICQKINSAKIGFVLIRITEGLQEYDNYLRLLNNFLVNEDIVTAQYFIDVCVNLPSYGDHLSTLNAVVDSDVMVEGFEGPVEKSDLQDIVKKIHENVHNGGVSLKSFRGMNKVINDYMRERRKITDHLSKQIGLWLDLKNSLTESLDGLRDRLYKLSAYLDFAKSGETRIKPALDNSGSSSLRPMVTENSISFGNNSFGPMFGESSVPPGHSSGFGDMFDPAEKLKNAPNSFY